MKKPEHNRIWFLPALLALLTLLCACAEGPVPSQTAPVVLQTPPPLEEPVPLGTLRISEIMVKNRACLMDGDGAFPDWAELENISAEPVDLSGWVLSDGADKQGLPFSEQTLAPGERLVVFLGQERTGFSLSQGETLVLRSPGGILEDSVFCASDRADVSWQLQADGGWTESEYPSPGFENSGAGYEAWQETLSCSSPLQIWEVCVFNPGDLWYDLGDSDWVELKNVSSESVWLGDYYLSDDGDEPLAWQLPQRSLEPGNSYLLLCDSKPGTRAETPLCTAFSLNDAGEQLYLSLGDGTIVDYVSLLDLPYACTMGRQAGQAGWFRIPSASPGGENRPGYRRVTPSPVSLSPDGVFDGVSSVTVALSGEGVIRYSTGRDLPDENSPVYSGPFELTKTGVVRAVATEAGCMPSRPLNLSYIINEGHSLPVLSLVSNQRRFSGIYDNGYKGMEVPGSLSLYETEGGGFSVNCGIRMHGETSLVLPKKNMSVRFRGSYGDDCLDYDVYGGGVTEFGSLILRAGQDYYSTIVRNELCENMALAASDRLMAQRNRYCILYMDGVYNGIYALTERTNDEMTARFYGVSEQSVTVMEAEISWDTELFTQLFDFCMKNDLSVEANYEYVCSLLDIDNLIDWCLIEGWSGNTDLTLGNLRYCRSTENDGRWRLILYDLDATLNTPENEFTNIFSPFNLQTRQVSHLIRPLLKNPDFRARLLTRAGELLSGPLSNQAVLEEFDRLTEQIAPEVYRDYARFGLYEVRWQSSRQTFHELIEGKDWAGTGVWNLCQLLDVSEEEKALYFPDF